MAQQPPPGRFDDEDFTPEPPANDAPRSVWAPKLKTIETIGADEIFAPLPPVDWTIEGLGLTAGAASALVGFGFVGKTIVAQTMLLATASGRRLWDLFSVGKGRALHLDFEQGLRLTSERYQRLARGTGLTRADLADNLRVGIMPTVYLDSPGAADVYARALDGYRVAVVDSLRAAAPSADENSSDVRKHIDVLTRASELTGCLSIFLHHARKPNDSTAGGAKMAIRGSSAIFDACASVFVLEGQKNSPTRVHHEKDRVRGVLMPDFGLQIEDVEIGGDPKAGLRVVHLEPEQLRREIESGRPSEKFDELKRVIFETVRSAGELPSLNAIASRVSGGNKTDKLQAMRELIDEGRLLQRGEGGPYRAAA